MAKRIEDKIVFEDKLAIFTLKDETAVRDIREYVIEHWHTLMQHMDGLTVLFIAGIHGSDSGELLSPDSFSDIKTLKNQVRSFSILVQKWISSKIISLSKIDVVYSFLIES